VFVDIFGVVLVEQFWSLTNTLYSSVEGKRWYGFLGTGGVLGGLLGAAAAMLIVKHTSLTTPDLLLVAVGILGLVVTVNLALARSGVFEAAANPSDTERPIARGLLRDRYLMLVGATVLLAQVAEPLVEYEFMKMVELNYTELDARTAFISWLFSTMGLVSILVNLAITPVVHRYLGVVAGLMTQPLLLFFCTFGFILSPTLVFGSAMKVSDRGLSYSINRASKDSSSTVLAEAQGQTSWKSMVGLWKSQKRSATSMA
jgi:ATP:ADP antiporter, AAA family